MLGVEPCGCNVSTMRSAKAALATPITCRRTRPGLAIGPSRLNTVGMPISRRDGPAKRNAGWNAGAKQKPMPGGVDAVLDTLRRRARSPTPSSSSTSAVPHFDEAALAPCLHTGTPAPATTIAAIVDTLIECESIAAGADDVDAVVALVLGERDDLARRQHGVEQSRQLLGALALGAQGDDEPISWAGVASPDQDRRHRRGAWSAVR